MRLKYYNLALLAFFMLFFAGCKKSENTTILKDDCIKRTLGPNVVGLKMEFAYAMALPKTAGKITSAQVEATIAGATGTYLENNSYYTNASGVDVPVLVGSASVTTTTKTEVTFTKGTCASTLRYYYVIPEEARGKSVSFTFTAKSSNGEVVSRTMGPYTITKMDMKLDLVLSDNNNSYLSIADMTAYNAATAATNADKVDLVYLYRSISGITFNHALVSPAATTYLPGITLPTGVNKSTKVSKTWGLRDQQLARLQYGIFIDDLDFVQLDLSTAPNYAIGMKAEAGLWVETADGKYRAYVYVNKIDDAAKTMTVSIKRYLMK
jgi:hypothetical protein